VLVCEWSSEDRHHGVACELLQRAAEALHFAPGTHEVLTLERTHVLGIGLLRACSEADKVDEDDADELSFLVRHGPSSYRNAESSPRLQGFERGFDPVVRLPTGDDFPSDVVGWDGYLYPWTFSVHDFEPITGRIDQPPPSHQTFQGQNFVICSFCPRKLDFDPLAVPIPYHHSNLQSEEMIYYVSGKFGSRRGVDVGSITLHPSGLPHGPQPGLAEKSI